MKKVVLALATASLLSSGAAQAELFDRGGGLLYDNVLNVTWLQDANYAQSSGQDIDGRMTWSQATSWAANLVYHDSVRNVDYSDWRLASNTPVNGTSWNESVSAAGTTDRGYNITSPHSELSYMYYVNLGLKGTVSATGASQPGAGVPGTSFGGWANVTGVDNVTVNNLGAYAYWSGTAYAPSPANFAWLFYTSIGGQYYAGQLTPLAAWAVRPGDVAAVPEPETYALLLAGMGLLAGVAKRRRSFGAA